MSLVTPESIRRLPRELCRKAKVDLCHGVVARHQPKLAVRRVPCGEASRRAGCGKSARPAYSDWKNLADNPYAFDTINPLAWEDGWFEARDEDME